MLSWFRKVYGPTQEVLNRLETEGKQILFYLPQSNNAYSLMFILFLKALTYAIDAAKC